MDDLRLIQEFIDAFVQGKSVMLSNANLRTELVLDSLQLVSKRGSIVAFTNLKQRPSQLMVNYGLPYWSNLHEALMQHEFFPVSDRRSQRCYQYQRCDVPQGYQVECTSAKDLWRTCWSRGSLGRSGIPLDLLIYHPDTAYAKQDHWYPIRGMDCQGGKLVVKMLGKEEYYDPETMVVWLKQVGFIANNFKTPERKVRPDIRRYMNVNL